MNFLLQDKTNLLSYIIFSIYARI